MENRPRHRKRDSQTGSINKSRSPSPQIDTTSDKQRYNQHWLLNQWSIALFIVTLTSAVYVTKALKLGLTIHSPEQRIMNVHATAKTDDSAFGTLPQTNIWALCSNPAGKRGGSGVYTVDPTRAGTAECIAVKSGKIDFVGSYDDLKLTYSKTTLSMKITLDVSVFQPIRFEVRFPRWAGNVISRARTPTWGGRTASYPQQASINVHFLNDTTIAVPGLADAHAHIIENGYMLRLPLRSATSITDAVARVAEYAAAHPVRELQSDVGPDVGHDDEDGDGDWVEGMGWDHTKWKGAQFPTAADLAADPRLENRLVSLTRVDGHAKWVSPAVLKLIGELPERVDGGFIVRDDEGNPTGIFIDNAMDLVPVPPWSERLMQSFFGLTIEEALKRGLTSIHDADTSPARIEFFKQLAESGKLPIRLYLMGYIESSKYWGDEIPRLDNYGLQERLNLRSVKIFADGALGSWSAALLEPYTDRQDEQGLMRYTPDALRELIPRFAKDGWQTNVHCIGDKANKLTLDIFEEVLGNENVTAESWRPRIEHAVMLTPQDLDRIGRLGVIASVQPTQATTDMSYAEGRMGPERIKTAYAYQSLLRGSKNQIIPLGSDFPVEDVNPLLGFYAAVTRLSVDGTSPHGSSGWFPDERLTRAQALKGMTYDAAYASFAENEIGSLRVGKKADFVILDRDIMTVPHEEILEAQVLATVVDGEVVFGSLPDAVDFI